ncbi:putative palmitoyltransferase ZDHHC13 isoform X1 [Colossoma macropomum]|uniref:putative palmitoyltransferase ZDHHC13 isoform X1 n=1 Tax=Colossoma macropomum TaxID=42526 RepID=UPI00186484E7|nr:putative palmitoyltransferase ZDHHC13 isoform X1 [Colossoma macropomum]
MEWEQDEACHSHGHGHMNDGCHGHGGHSHSHGPGGMAHGFMPGFHGQFVQRSDSMLDSTQQPKKYLHIDDSSSWDIVKATQFGALERCKELVEAGYDVRQPDKENVTLLHWAAINNRADLVKYYIAKGAVVDQLGGDLNSTPVQWAIRQGHLQMVIQLMRYGADPSLADGEGYRGLHLAVLFQHMPIAAYLMAKGQEVDVPDSNGQTSLMLAAQKIIGPEPTNFLLKCNASVNAVDKVNRNSPLHCAVLAGNVDAVHILLEAGASVDLQNANGHTPIDLAHQVHSPLLIHMLNVVQKERIKSNSPCLRVLNKYRVCVQCVFSVCVLWAVGAVLDMNSESWLLKGVLLACILAVINLTCRRLATAAVQALIPSTALIASIFWMLVTWCFWFLPDGPSASVQVLFTLTVTSLLYYFFRTCRTDPGVIRATEEEKKKNIVVLAEAGCLDPRIFCTSCMMRKPMRAHHCFICNACIAKQDHHSIWINGCIGARNHQFFVLFLITLNLLGVWMFYGSIKYWSNHCMAKSSEQNLWGFVTGLVGCSPWVLYIFCMTFFHVTWASILLTHQLYQIAFLGLTTAERSSLMLSQRKLPHSFSLRQNPFKILSLYLSRSGSRGVLKNLVNFFQLRCCGLCKPLVLDWTQEFPMGLNRDHPMFNSMDPV